MSEWIFQEPPHQCPPALILSIPLATLSTDTSLINEYQIMACNCLNPLITFHCSKSKLLTIAPKALQKRMLACLSQQAMVCL